MEAVGAYSGLQGQNIKALVFWPSDWQNCIEKVSTIWTVKADAWRNLLKSSNLKTEDGFKHVFRGKVRSGLTKSITWSFPDQFLKNQVFL